MFLTLKTKVGTYCYAPIKNGAHSFISGSNRSFGIPAELLKGYYIRLNDRDVFQFYAPEDRIEFTGLRGTIIAEDTRGLHKGKHVQAGDRLIFQLQYCNSVFGGQVTSPKLESPKSVLFAKRLKQWPRLYSTFRS